MQVTSYLPVTKLHASYVSAYLDQEVLLQALGLLLVSLAL